MNKSTVNPINLLNKKDLKEQKETLNILLDLYSIDYRTSTDLKKVINLIDSIQDYIVD